MIPILLMLLTASQPARTPDGSAAGRTAWLVASIQHSEWCPAANVRIDLRTGRYAFTGRAPRAICKEEGLQRPVQEGRLRGEQLQTVRVAFQRALAEGLEKAACRGGGAGDTVIVSNGGTPILVLASGARTAAAPDQLGCWSEAAGALHHVLEDVFGVSRPR
jgi:hypothetical protein